MLVAEHLPALAGVTLMPLLQELGCVILERNSANEWKAVYSSQPLPANEALVRETLIAIMRSHLKPDDRYFYTDGVAILDGLLRHHRWQRCLESVEDAYCFAELMLRTSAILRSNPEIVTQEYRETLSSAMGDALLEWLPAIGRVEPLHANPAMLRAMFGDAWFELVLENADVDPYNIPSYIRQTKPAFIPGVVRASQDVTMALPLPSLEAGL